MDDRGHRSRRGRSHSTSHTFIPPNDTSKTMTICRALGSLLLFVGLIVTISTVLEYHCTTCEAKCSMNSLTKNIEDIARNLASIEKNYHELETQISQFSRELPKIEGQIEILEALATTMEHSQCRFKVWEPRSQWCLPNVDVSLARGDVNANLTNYTDPNPIADPNIADSNPIEDQNLNQVFHQIIM